MNDLILLCAGAATDTATDIPQYAGFVPPAIAPLATLLARGGVVSDISVTGDPLAELPEDAWLRTQFGVPETVAIQALAAHRHGIPPPCWRLTPCHLHLAMDHALLTDPPHLQLTPDDAAALAAAVADTFEAAGLQLQVPSPEVWFAQGAPWALQTWPWTLASGRNISAYQPAGARARDWRRLLTEVQMRWYDHPVNQRRAEAGLQPVNALWLDGFLTAALPASAGILIADSPVLGGLAQAAGWSVHPFSAGPTAGQANRSRSGLSTSESATDITQENTGPTVIDIDGWRTPRRLGDATAWLAGWAALADWLSEHAEPIAAAARAGRLRVVLTGERRILTLTAMPPKRWQFWRRFDARTVIGGQSRSP